MKIEQRPIPVPFAEVRPPPPPPPVQPQDAPDPIPAMVFFLPPSQPRRTDYQENGYFAAAPFRPVSDDSYSQTKDLPRPVYQEDSYRPFPREEDSFGYVPVAPSMAPIMQQRPVPYVMQPYQPIQQPLSRDLIINYNRPYGGYERFPEQTDVVEPPQDEVPPPQQQKTLDFNGNNDDEEQQQPEAAVNEVEDAEVQNRSVRQEVQEEDQDDDQEEVVPALVFFLKKKGVTHDYKVSTNSAQ